MIRISAAKRVSVASLRSAGELRGDLQQQPEEDEIR
jgi:hypothetical protein